MTRLRWLLKGTSRRPWVCFALALLLGLLAWLANHYAMLWQLEAIFAAGPFSPINAEYQSSDWLSRSTVAEIERRQAALRDRSEMYGMICRGLAVAAAVAGTASLACGAGASLTRIRDSAGSSRALPGVAGDRL